MKSEAQICIEVEAYWNKLVNSAQEGYRRAFVEINKDAGIKVVVGVNALLTDAVLVPDYTDISIDYKNYKKAEQIIFEQKKEKQSKLLKVLESINIQYEKIFCDVGVYRYMLKVRSDIKQTSNEYSRDLSCLESKIRNTYKSNSNMLPMADWALKEAADNIKYAINYYKLFVKYTDNWFKALGIDPNTDKDYRKHSCWDKIITDLFNAYGPSTKASRVTAEILEALYPKIWGKDPHKKNSEVVRKRMERKPDARLFKA